MEEKSEEEKKKKNEWGAKQGVYFCIQIERCAFCSRLLGQFDTLYTRVSAASKRASGEKCVSDARMLIPFFYEPSY